MDIQVLLSALVFGYLLGAISTSRIFGRITGKTEELDSIEVPIPGSDETYKVTSTGAAAASMRMGARAGCTIGLLDILKVALPTLAFYLLYPAHYYHLAAAIGGMLGHNWPVFNHFQGGRGVSVAYGGFFVVDFFGAIASSVAGLIFGLFVLRDFILAYLAGMWFFILWVWFTTRDWIYVGYAIVINILVFVAMIPDLRQLQHAKKIGMVDTSAVLATTPMGRGMLKIMKFFKLDKKL